MDQANEKIRKEMRLYNVPFWKLAIRWGCSEVTAIRRFRVELPAEEQAKLIAIVHELAGENKRG